MNGCLLCCAVLQSSAGWEEYVDYFFPEDERGLGSLKLLENAAKWGAMRLAAAAGAGAGAGAGAAVGQKRKAEGEPDDDDAGAEPAVAPVADADAVDIDDV